MTDSSHAAALLRLRKRLWLGGLAIALALATLVVGNQVIAPDKSIGLRMVGHDFMAFYTAGHFMRASDGKDLYNLDAVREYQRDLARREGLEVGPSFGPFWNPPFYAWVFTPLAELPYHRALFAWTGINLICLLIAIAILIRILNAREPARRLSPEQAYELRLCREDFAAGCWKSWGLVPLFIFVSFPFVQAILHGQNTFFSLCVLSAVVYAWRRRRAVIAGLLTGVLFYKPQLGAVVALVLVIDLGWRALGGVMITGIALLAVTLYTMPLELLQYQQRLAANLHFMQIENAYLWERHATLRAFWRLLLQGRDAGEASRWVTIAAYASTAVVAGWFVLAMVRSSRSLRHATPVDITRRRDRMIAAAIAVMPLVMPFYFDYDLLLLAISAVLLGRELRHRIHQEDRSLALTKADRWTIRAFIALFLWLMVNPGFARTTHVGLTVPLLAGLSLFLSARLAQSNATATAVASIPKLTRQAA